MAIVVLVVAVSDPVAMAWPAGQRSKEKSAVTSSALYLCELTRKPRRERYVQQSMDSSLLGSLSSHKPPPSHSIKLDFLASHHWGDQPLTAIETAVILGPTAASSDYHRMHQL